MVSPAAVRSGRRRRGRPPGIWAAVIARVRHAGDRVSSPDSSSVTAAAGLRGQPAAVDSGCRSGARRPLRSCRFGELLCLSVVAASSVLILCCFV